MRISDCSSDVCSSDLLTPAQLRNKMVRASMDKFQVAIHAIGDAANAEALDAIADLSRALPGGRRWRIEHAQIVDPADIPRFAPMKGVARPRERLAGAEGGGRGRTGWCQDNSKQ